MLLRVVKVGGSLFDWPDLPLALDRWLRREHTRSNVLVAGGGDHAELIRDADRRWQLDAEVSHQLALGAMNLNGQLLAALLAPLRSCTVMAHAKDLDRWLRSDDGHGTAVVQLERFLAEEEQRCQRSLVERSWRVTSDSLAAWLGSLLVAAGHQVELVLLKSSTVEPGQSLLELQRAEVVDPCVEEYTHGLDGVRLVNLRAVRP